jgi:hypothetical protein
MTVYIEKPAVNLREELASLRNQGGYQEQQFYFDGLVTNGTDPINFTTGWVPRANATLSVSGGNLVVTTPAAGVSRVYQAVSVSIGRSYSFSWDTTLSGSGFIVAIGNSIGATNVFSSSSQTGATTFVATTSVVYVEFGCTTASASDTYLLSSALIFEVDASDDVVHRLPKGWVPKDVYEDGLLQREGAAHDYEVVYDGFDYFVKPTVAPSATTQTCVIGVKA